MSIENSNNHTMKAAIYSLFCLGIFCACGQNQNEVKKSDKDSSLTQSKKNRPPCDGDQPILFNADLGDGYRMEIVGTNRDMVKFYYQNIDIGFDPIRDGDCLYLYYQKPSRINANLHINHVQFGKTRERGEFYCYAIIDKIVYRSPVWIETQPGDYAMELKWEGTKGNIWQGMGSANQIIASFSFDIGTRNWTCIPGTRGITKGNTVIIKPEH